jgi:hypothetical protein
MTSKVHLQTRLISASKLAQSRPRRASLSSLDYCLQVCTIMASGESKMDPVPLIVVQAGMSTQNIYYYRVALSHYPVVGGFTVRHVRLKAGGCFFFHSIPTISRIASHECLASPFRMLRFKTIQTWNCASKVYAARRLVRLRQAHRRCLHLFKLSYALHFLSSTGLLEVSWTRLALVAPLLPVVALPSSPARPHSTPP